MQIDKYNSLELTLQSLASGNEERVLRDKAAAEERERIQRDRDASHQKQVRELDDQVKATEARAKEEIQKLYMEHAQREAKLQEALDDLKRSHNAELDKLNKYEHHYHSYTNNTDTMYPYMFALD